MNHRGNIVGNHVSLYYEGFQRFKYNCEVGNPDSNDCVIAMQLCKEMSRYFKDESKRRDAIVVVLKEYLPPGTNVRVEATTASGGRCDIIIEDFVNFEVKMEVGTGSSDTSSEGHSHYLASLNQYKDLCPVPRFIIEVVGPNIFVSGMAYGEHVYVDRLIPVLWLVPQYNDWKAMKSIAQMLRALKEEIRMLKIYYANLPVLQPRFPFFQSIMYKDTLHTINYQKTINNHLFLATVDGLSEVYVKFTERYSKDAHELLHSNNFAPKLYFCGKLGIYQVVVMEYISNNMQINEYLSSHPSKKEDMSKQCDRALHILHSNGYCHGDFRESNVLVRDNGTICVIDFEWSGKDGSTKYPLFMNTVNVAWPQGATDGQLILKSHDIRWKNELFRT